MGNRLYNVDVNTFNIISATFGCRLGASAITVGGAVFVNEDTLNTASEETAQEVDRNELTIREVHDRDVRQFCLQKAIDCTVSGMVMGSITGNAKTFYDFVTKGETKGN